MIFIINILATNCVAPKMDLDDIRDETHLPSTPKPAWNPSTYITQWGKIYSLGTPFGIAVNATGYIYVADTNQHRVQVFTPLGAYLTKWGSSGSENGNFSGPYGIAVNTSGYVYVADTDNNRVQVFTSSGLFVTKWGASGLEDGNFSNPRGITVNATGYVYVTDWSNQRVQVFTQTGQFVTKWGTAGSADGEFNHPWGIAANATGHIYVVEQHGYRVQVFTQTGQYLSKWNKSDGSSGSGNGEFNIPLGIAVNESGHVFVTDANNNRVQVFTQTGQFLAVWTGLAYPTGIAVTPDMRICTVEQNQPRVQIFAPNGQLLKVIGTDSSEGNFKTPENIAVNATGHIYVSDTGNHRIQVFSPNGQFLFNWGSYGTEDGEFSSPNGIAINQTGYVYVVDETNARVQVFSQTGQFLFKWNKTIGGPGNGDGEFADPRGIAVNASGYVYVVDAGNARVQCFTPSGLFVNKWGELGSEDGNFSTPRGVAVNNTGHVYVADASNHRIQVFTQTGQFVSKWGTIGSADGEFSTPHGISVNASGNVFVADTGNSRIQVFTQTGQFLLKWNKTAGGSGTSNGEFSGPRGINAQITGLIYVADTNNDRIQVFGNRPPVASNLIISPSSPLTSNDLVLEYSYNDPDGDLAQMPRVRWYKNNALQDQFNDLLVLPATATLVTDFWNASIEAFDGTNYGNPAWSQTVTIGNTAPATITNLAATPQNDTTILLTWTAPGEDEMAGNASGYILKYTLTSITSEAEFNVAATWLTGTPRMNGTLETYNLTGLIPDVTYTFALKTFDEANVNSSISNVVSEKTNDTQSPETITNLETSNPQLNNLTLTWTAPGDNGGSGTVAGYILKYSTSPITAGNFDIATTYNTEGWTGLVVGGSVETRIVTSLTPLVQYYFALKAIDEVPNNSSISNVATGTPASGATDADGDGMPDGWEVQNLLDPLDRADSNTDADIDGLLNRYEYGNGTNPRIADTDGDGLADGVEVITYHTDPLVTDTDGDGFTDNEEVVAGTNPLNASDNPQTREIILIISVMGAVAGMSFVTLKTIAKKHAARTAKREETITTLKALEAAGEWEKLHDMLPTIESLLNQQSRIPGTKETRAMDWAMFHAEVIREYTERKAKMDQLLEQIRDLMSDRNYSKAGDVAAEAYQHVEKTKLHSLAAKVAQIKQEITIRMTLWEIATNIEEISLEETTKRCHAPSDIVVSIATQMLDKEIVGSRKSLNDNFMFKVEENKKRVNQENLPFPAYQGDEPFIFVSYAHNDKAQVYPILRRLYREGYRIWYDEGIPAASDFLEHIATKVEKCTFFMVFVSPVAFESSWVKDEVKFGLECNKKFIEIHLQETKLENWYRMRLGHFQRILKYEMNDAQFNAKLHSTPELQVCKDSIPKML